MTEFFTATTPHFNARKPFLIVIHGTECGDEQARHILGGHSTHEASAHYYIDDKGEVIQYLDETVRAWHAGKSHWAGLGDVNSLSVGIELLAISRSRKFDGSETFYTEPQIEALVGVCRRIIDTFKIAPHHILGHQDVDSGRPFEPMPGDTLEEILLQPVSQQKKYDPGPFFPWEKLAAHGIGAWHGLTDNGPSPVVTDPARIAAFKTGLTMYGYDTRSAPTGREFADVVRAFQTHFLPWQISGEVTEQAIQALVILLQKKFAA